jgi:hypothetical protein
MSGDSKKSYEVGYRKPPIATRFQKGTSGNPSGRPKKHAQPLDPGTVLQSIDNEEIVVIDNGKRKRMTKAEIGFRQLFTKATRGDLTAARLCAGGSGRPRVRVHERHRSRTAFRAQLATTHRRTER